MLNTCYYLFTRRVKWCLCYSRNEYLQNRLKNSYYT